jgi:hypothetical protein
MNILHHFALPRAGCDLKCEAGVASQRKWFSSFLNQTREPPAYISVFGEKIFTLKEGILFTMELLTHNSLILSSNRFILHYLINFIVFQE